MGTAWRFGGRYERCLFGCEYSPRVADVDGLENSEALRVAILGFPGAILGPFRARLEPYWNHIGHVAVYVVVEYRPAVVFDKSNS